MLVANIDARGAEVRKNGSRVVLFIAALVLMVPDLSRAFRFGFFGALFAAGLFMRFQAKKQWCALRACGLKTPL